MKKDVVILLAEDDEGHAALVKSNLADAGIINEIRHFKDGQQLIDFLFSERLTANGHGESGYILLLDIRMPKMDGIEALEKIKTDERLRKMPVIMITTTDDPKEVERCHDLGCSNYIVKPIDYVKFTNAMRQLGLFLNVVEVPSIQPP